MANDQESRGNPEDLGQDPYVERRRPDPSQPPEEVRIQEGLLGDSDREGYKRLYFTRELDNYARFRTEDVVFREPIPSEQAPLVGLEATRVGIRRDAAIEYMRVRAPRPVDEFDLDVRLGGHPPDVPPGSCQRRTNYSAPSTPARTPASDSPATFSPAKPWAPVISDASSIRCPKPSTS